MSVIISSKASSMMQLMSGTNVYVCEFVWKKDLLSIELNFNNANNNNVVLHILLVNFVNIKELLEVLGLNAAEFRHFRSFIFYKVVQRHI